MEFQHIPVLLEESIRGLNIHPEGTYVDATVGGGGHSLRIVSQLTSGRLIAIDQDEEALAAAKERLSDYEDHIVWVHDNFRHLKHIMDRLGVSGANGILMDIGVSSHQIDEASRGFTFQENVPLDMRMDQNAEIPTARDIINTYSAQQLTQLFYTYGEERWSKRIADFIIDERGAKPIETSFDLVKVIQKAIPKKVRSQDKNPARRVFQALRIEVNHELEALEEAIQQAVDVLLPGGRLCIITFHSLEDRIVKQAFRRMEQGPPVPAHLPVRHSDYVSPAFRVNRKPIVADDAECMQNPRAHSAKLRILEKKSRHFEPERMGKERP